MLTLALAATLIGFGLLVVALITGNFWLAVACIVVCVIGLLVLLVDTVRSSRRGGGAGDEPLFTIRDREPGERAAPLHDDEPSAPSGQPGATASPADSTRATASGSADSDGDSGPRMNTGPRMDTGAPSGGLGSLVDRGAAAPGSSPEDAASGTLPGDPGAGGDVGEADVVTGDANDYVKSVTGSFPIPIHRPPTGAWPTSSSPIPGAGETAPAAGPAGPRSADRPHVSSGGPATGPLPAASPYVGRRRRAADADAQATPDAAAADTAVDGNPADPTPADSTAGARPGGPSTDFRPVGPAPAAWTRQHETSSSAQAAGDGLVVHDHTGPLPKMTFKHEEE